MKTRSFTHLSLHQTLGTAVGLCLALGSLTACGPAFKQQDTQGNDVISSNAVQLRSAQLKTIDGEVSWNPLNNNELSLEFEVKVPYRRVFKMSSQVVKALIPFTCQAIPGIMNSAVQSYKQGEIPCGGIIDNDWKQLLSITVDPMSGTSDGFNYFVTGTTIPVMISRAQNSGSYSESNLDSKSNETRTSSPQLGEDISLRYNPEGTKAQIELCMNVPGATVTSTRQSVNAKAWKNVLGVKVSYDSDFEINPGQARFDYARGCFAMDFGWMGKELAPQLNLKTTMAPQLSNAQYSGLNIKISDWFLRLADNVMDFFKFSIRSKVQEKMVGKVNSMLDSDVETGRWFTRIHGEERLQEVGRKVTQQIANSVARIGLPSSTEELRTQVKDNCRLKKMSISEDWTDRLEQFCKYVVSEIQIEIEPFHRDQDSAAKGCYSHMARLHDSQNKWWANECHFAVRFKVSLPLPFKEFTNELKLMIASQISVDRIPEAWQERLQELKIDEATLAIVLEQLEAQGLTQVTAGDLGQRAAPIIEQLRAQAALFE